MPAFQAQTQMDPRIAGFEALFAYMLICRREPDLIDMFTFSHELPPGAITDFGLNGRYLPAPNPNRRTPAADVLHRQASRGQETTATS